MREVSNLYRAIINTGTYRTECKLDIYTGRVRVENLVGSFGMNKLIEMSTTRGLLPDSGDLVGNCVSGQIDVTFYPTDDNGNNIEIPKGATLVPSMRVASESLDAKSEWLQKGVFYVDTRSYNSATGVLNLHGFDALAIADSIRISTAFPPLSAQKTEEDYVNLVASHLNVSVDERTWTDEVSIFTPLDRNKIVSFQGPSFRHPEWGKYTCREILSKIAAPHFSNFEINEDGKLQAVQLFTNVKPPLAYIDRSAKIVTIKSPSKISGMHLQEDYWGEIKETDYGDNSESVVNVKTHQTAKSLAEETFDWYKRYIDITPYYAEGAIIPPHIELGDAIRVDALDAPMQCQEITFGSLPICNAYYPGQGKEEHEFVVVEKYQDEQDRILSTKTNEDDVRDIVENYLSDYNVPVELGGTGVDVQKETVSVTNDDTVASSHNIHVRYYPYLGMCFVRGTAVVTNQNVDARTFFTVASIDSNYSPQYTTALSVSVSSGAFAVINQSGEIRVGFEEATTASTTRYIYLSGWWIVAQN